MIEVANFIIKVDKIILNVKKAYKTLKGTNKKCSSGLVPNPLETGRTLWPLVGEAGGDRGLSFIEPKA